MSTRTIHTGGTDASVGKIQGSVAKYYFISKSRVNRSHSSAVPRPRGGRRVAAMTTALGQLRCVLDALDEISTGNGDTVTRARELCDKFSSGVTILALQMALVVFEPLEELCKSLQARTQTVSGMRQAADRVITFLQSQRSQESFSFVYVNANDIVKSQELDEITMLRVRKAPKRLTMALHLMQLRHPRHTTERSITNWLTPPLRSSRTDSASRALMTWYQWRNVFSRKMQTWVSSKNIRKLKCLVYESSLFKMFQLDKTSPPLEKQSTFSPSCHQNADNCSARSRCSCDYCW